MASLPTEDGRGWQLANETVTRWTSYIPFNNPWVTNIRPFHKGVNLRPKDGVTCPVSLRHTEQEQDLNPALSPQS